MDSSEEGSSKGISLRRRYEEVPGCWCGGAGYIGLAHDAKHKKCSRGASGAVPRTCAVAAHSKNTGSGCRRPYRSFHGVPQAPAPDFCRPGQQFDGDCKYLSGQSHSERQGVKRTSGRALCSGIGQNLCGQRRKRRGQSL